MEIIKSARRSLAYDSQQVPNSRQSSVIEYSNRPSAGRSRQATLIGLSHSARKIESQTRDETPIKPLKPRVLPFEDAKTKSVQTVSREQRIHSTPFNLETHKPPRIDSLGFNKDPTIGRDLLNRNAKNILAQSTKVPAQWAEQGKISQLAAQTVSLPSDEDSLSSRRKSPQRQSRRETSQIVRSSVQRQDTLTAIKEDLEGEANPRASQQSHHPKQASSAVRQGGNRGSIQNGDPKLRDKTQRTNPRYRERSEKPPLQGAELIRMGYPTTGKEELAEKIGSFEAKEASDIPLFLKKQVLRSSLGEKMTRTKLLEARRIRDLPDLSYDFDGDQAVGSKDYVIAKRFDASNKHSLTNEERTEALTALKAGLEKQFAWNLEAQGAHRGQRIINSKGGTVINADDKIRIIEPFTLGSSIDNSDTGSPRVGGGPKLFSKPREGEPSATLNELLKKRRETERKDIVSKQKVKEELMESLKKQALRKSYRPDDFVETPKYTALWQKQDEETIEWRKRGGLEPLPKDSITFNYRQEPTMEWKTKPEIVSATELKKKRESSMAQELFRFKQFIDTHVDGKGRLEKRENAILRLAQKDPEGGFMNQQKLKDRRTQELISDMTKKFGEQVLGVHGQELPKFSTQSRTKQYWKMEKNFVESPRFKSYSKMKQEQKFWAKNDEGKLADTTGELFPQDPFKAVHVRGDAKNERTPDVRRSGIKNKSVIVNSEFRKGWKPLLKWSENEKNHKCEGPEMHKRTFEKIYDRADQDDLDEIDRLIKVEHTKVRQAPKCMRSDLQVKLEEQVRRLEMFKRRGSSGLESSHKNKGQQGHQGKSHQAGGNESLRGSVDSSSQFDHYGAKEADASYSKKRNLSNKFGSSKEIIRDLAQTGSSGILDKKNTIESGGGMVKNMMTGSGLQKGSITETQRTMQVQNISLQPDTFRILGQPTSLLQRVSLPQEVNETKGNSTRKLFRGESTVDSSAGFASSTRVSQGHQGSVESKRPAPSKYGTEDSRFRRTDQSSPFRDTVAVGVVTGAGFMRKK